MIARRKLPHELRLPRRTVLRGIAGGVALALGLPLLDAMRDDNGEALADGAPLPRRMLTWMWGNGCRLEHWVPAQQGPDYALSAELAPLAPVKDYITVLTGFRNTVAGRRGHHDGMAGLFSGHPFIQIDALGAPYASKFGGKSIDQRAADLIAEGAFYKSLQVGVSKRHLTSQGPTLETMSHRGPDQPLMAERDPQRLYDKLFQAFIPKDEDPEGALRTVALDAVMGDVERLSARVSSADRQRLEHHLESLFELQKQILALPPTCDLPPKPDKLDYNLDGSEPLAELNAAMTELVALAFACDLTRVVSFMFTGASGAQQFSTLTPSEFPDYPGATDYSHADHHMVSHINAPYEQDFIHRSVVFCMESLSHLLQTLKATPEGDGNLLDSLCVLAGSDVTEGWNHSENDYPIVIAGRAGGRLRSDVGHYRTPAGESLSNVGLACLKAVAPDPSAVTDYGSDADGFDGYTTVPCAAILA